MRWERNLDTIRLAENLLLVTTLCNETPMIAALLRCTLVGLFVLLALGGEAVAQTWRDGLSDIYRDPPDDRTNRLRYRTYLPQNYDPAQEYPLILYLHANGQQGTDGVRHVQHLASQLISKAYSDYPAIVLAPQASIGTGWYAPDTMNLVLGLMRQTLAGYSVDANRLYMSGVSMGGFGNLDYLYNYSNAEPGYDLEFAAVAPLAAGFPYLGDLSETDPYRDTPIWLFHGDNDGTVDVESSRDAYRTFTGRGPNDPIPLFDQTDIGYPTAIDGNVRYSEIPNGGHVTWVDSAYSRPAFYEWMLSQSLNVPEPSGLLLGAFAAAAAAAARAHRPRDRGSAA